MDKQAKEFTRGVPVKAVKRVARVPLITAWQVKQGELPPWFDDAEEAPGCITFKFAGVSGWTPLYPLGSWLVRTVEVADTRGTIQCLTPGEYEATYEPA